MLELFSMSFVQRALAAGVILSIVLGFISFFIVNRRFSFIGVGIAHSAFGGLALGLLLGVSPTITAFFFALLVANLIGFISRSAQIETDTAIGIFFSFSMAIGVIFIGLTKDYNVDLFGYLFGNILAISIFDLWIMSFFGALVVVTLALLYKELLFTGFDTEVARASGIHTVFLEHLLLSLIALSVVMSIKMVGIILASALLVIPGATAAFFSDFHLKAVFLSVIIAVLTTVSGIFIACFIDLAPGASIVSLEAMLFFSIFIFKYAMSNK